MMVKDRLVELLTNKSARIGVIGLGYVGLPLVVEFALKGFSSIGFEVDGRKVEEIKAGRSYIPDVPTSNVKELVESGKLDATTDFNKLKDCDAIIICVPTPLRKTKEPDMSYILAAAKEIQRNIRHGQLVVLESTTYPGTTDEVLLPKFEEEGLKLDKDFLLAFSPERVDPGNPQFQTHNIPKVVGGCTEDSTVVAAYMYSQIVNDVHAVSSARVAEAAKLWENTFRAVNIGMANEMARLCYTLGIDTWEVIRAAATKPFGFMPFYPGPGIGGHCLVGNETVVIRSDDSNEQIKTLAEVFAEQKAIAGKRNFMVDEKEVIYQPTLKALSLNTETQMPQWKPVSYLFKREFNGSIVTVTTSDNRKVTVTDKHPMLVSDENGNLKEVFAKDLHIGDRLPIHVAAVAKASAAVGASSVSNQHSIGTVSTTQINSVQLEELKEPIDVYSIEVEDTHTFATSYGIYVHNCIPLDPHYLSWKARQHGFDSRFISLAEEVNSSMPQHVIRLVVHALNEDRKAVNGSRVLILGVAYKKDIDDMRESPALSIIDLLRVRKADVVYHDPFVANVDFHDAHTIGQGEPLSSIPLTVDEVKAADCIIIVTEHTDVDYKMITDNAKIIVDTRNALDEKIRNGSKARIIRL